MKKLFIGVISSVAVSATALAADLPARTYTKAPVMVSMAYNWTGFYVGVNAGGVWGNDPVTVDTLFSGAPAGLPAFASAAGSSTLKPSGFTGGGQVGYNYQFSNWVIGLEADINYAHLSRSVTSPTFTFPGSLDFFYVTSTTSNWMTTVRPRLGYAFDRTLLFVTGGLALSEINFAQSLTFVGPFISSGTTTSTRAGWTVGGGVEQAIAANWSAKVEYLHSDFGSQSFTTTNATFGNTNFSSSARFRTDLVRIGLNYKFGGPVVANY